MAIDFTPLGIGVILILFVLAIAFVWYLIWYMVSFAASKICKLYKQFKGRI